MSSKSFAVPVCRNVRSFAGARLASAMFLSACALPACGSADSADGPTGSSAEEALSVCAAGETVEGVDVSEYQGDVDWAAVKASGRAFAFARVSDGATGLDSDFAANWTGIKSAGLIRGAYQFFRASESGTTQADVFLSNVGTLGAGDLPPVLDVEVDDGESSAVIVSGVQEWITRIEQVTGKTPIVYTMPGFWNGVSGASQLATEVPLWDANWGVSCPSIPTGYSAWSFWQYVTTGTIAGISGNVDHDRFNGTLAELQTLAGITAAALSDSSTTVAAATSGTSAAARGAAYGEVSR